MARAIAFFALCVAAVALVATAASASLQDADQEFPLGKPMITSSSIPDLMGMHSPKRNERIWEEDIVVHGAMGELTQLKYRAVVSDDVVILDDFSTPGNGFLVLSVECSSTGMTIEVSDVKPALDVFIEGNVVVTASDVDCGQANGHGAAAIISSVSVQENKIVIAHDLESVLTAFDHVTMSFSHKLPTDDSGLHSPDFHHDDVPESRMRRSTVSGCECTSACELSTLFPTGTICDTNDCGEESCTLGFFNCDHYDFCTLERSMNFDVFTWNYVAGGSAQTSVIQLGSAGPINFYCDDCFAYIRVGVDFEFQLEGTSINLFALTLTGSAGANIGLRAVATGNFAFTSDDIALHSELRGPTIVIPLGPVPLPISFFYQTLAKFSVGASATITATAGAQYDRSVSFGLRYRSGIGFDTPVSYGGNGFSVRAPTLTVEADARAQAWIMPQLRIAITDWLPLSATGRLAPFAGISASLAGCGVAYDVFAGLDVTVANRAIAFDLRFTTITLVDAHTAEFNVIPKTTIRSDCLALSRRELDLTFVANTIFQRCDYECPENSECMNDNGVAACFCNEDYFPRLNYADGDTCELHESQVDCADISCDHLPNSECRYGQCYCKFGYLHMVVDGSDTCMRNPELSEDLCVTDAITCPPHSTCSNGDCVCDPGFALELMSTNQYACRPTIPCERIVCGENSLCINGNCHCAVGFRLADDGFNCVSFFPECGSFNPDMMDTTSCFDGAECVVDPNYDNRTHCACTEGYLSYDRMGAPSCIVEADNPCEDYRCLPGYVCELDTDGDATCVATEDPCAVDNGGCAVNAHCRQVPGTSGWNCECNHGFLGDPFRSCEMYDACAVHANGGCSIHATCESSGTDRTCTCREGFDGDGFSCRFTQCSVDNGGCDENAYCMRGSEYGEVRCQCKRGYSGDGYTCVSENPCLYRKGGCDILSGICYNRGGVAECGCVDGYDLVGEGNNTCVPQAACTEDNNIDCADANAFCVLEGSTPICTCSSGYEDVNGDGSVCEEINRCENEPELCSRENQLCLALPLGRYRCECEDGFRLNETRQCEPINPCTERGYSGCHRDAFCTYDGPGQSSCECADNFVGDGYTCEPINPCMEPEANMCDTETQDCVYLSPNNAACECKTGYRMAPSGGCEPIEMCNVLNGGCPPNSMCVQVAVGDVSCTCSSGFFPLLSERYTEGARATRACLIASVDIVTVGSPITVNKASELISAAFAASESYADVVISNVVLRFSDTYGDYGRVTVYAEQVEGNSAPVAVNATLVHDLVAAYANATDLSAAHGIQFVAVYTTRTSPYSPRSVAFAADPSTGSGSTGAGSLTSGEVAGLIIGLVCIVAISVWLVLFVRRNANFGASKIHSESVI